MRIAYGVFALVSAQLLVDLVLGQESVERPKKSWSWLQLAGHAALHAAVGWLFLGVGAAWPLAGLILLTHGLFDAIEDRIPNPGLPGFLVGQLIHLTASIGGLFLLRGLGITQLNSIWLNFLGDWALRIIIVVAGAGLAVFLGAEIVGGVVGPLRPQFEPRPDRPPSAPGDASDHLDRGFQEGGRIIGILERALIFVLVLIGQSGGIGFLVAAKSIFRFGELRQRSNRLEAEYILIGTLASFLWGLIIAALTKFLLSIQI